MSLGQQLGLADEWFVRQYFDGVSEALSREISSGNRIYREFSAAVLGLLMDGDSRFHAWLGYPLGRLNDDLDRYGWGSRVGVEFEVHERLTGSARDVVFDLGLILSMEDPVRDRTVERAILVAAKGLSSAGGDFSLRSRYDPVTADELRAVRKINDAVGDDVVCYFLFNPTLGAFDARSVDRIKSYERQLSGRRASLDRQQLNGFALMREAGYRPSLEDLRLERHNPAERTPGLRVLSAGLLDVAAGAQLSLETCYEFALSSTSMKSPSSVPFVTLSEFIVDFVGACVSGSSTRMARRVASGEELVLDSDDGDRPGRAVSVRYTLRVSVTAGTQRKPSEPPASTVDPPDDHSVSAQDAACAGPLQAT